MISAIGGNPKTRTFALSRQESLSPELRAELDV